MIKTMFALLLTAAVSLTVYLFIYLGVYKSVSIVQAKRGPLHMLYKDHIGAYHEIGPTITAVEDWARAKSVACPATFGEYLDDPDSVDQDRLRSHGGCLLASPLGQNAPDFNYEERPERQYVVAEFTGSPSIGPFKVYPKVKKYFAEQRLKIAGPAIEIYHVTGNAVTTEYLFPLP